MRLIQKLILLIICLLMLHYAPAQMRTVKFTGRDMTDQYRIQLSKVSVYNMDQLWEEVVYYPDTTMTMGGVGVEDYAPLSNFHLWQNVPNPFDGTTNFALSVNEPGMVTIEIFDLAGKMVSGSSFPNLTSGTHLFKATLATPQTYVLSANSAHGQTTIKLVNEGAGAADAIQYIGVVDTKGDVFVNLNDVKMAGSYPFSVGDEMQYAGYAMLDGEEKKSAVVQQCQFDDETVKLMFDVSVPNVVTVSASQVTGSSAVVSGSVVTDHNSAVANRGFCYSMTPNPTISNNVVTAGAGVGEFSATLTGLAPVTTYYFRAYAENGVGIDYGSQKAFTTTVSVPEVITDDVSNITSNTASCGGWVSATGGAAVTVRGVCWSASPNPTISDEHTVDGSGTGSFTSSMSNLLPGTTYYVRAYANNSAGTGYGEQKTFTTMATLPMVYTKPISGITHNSAICGGSVTATGGADVTQRGVCWGTAPNPTISTNHTVNGNGLGQFTDNLTNLQEGTQYYVRAYAINSVGIAYGGQAVFTTLSMPSVSTNGVTSITATSAQAGGYVYSDGGDQQVARGVCWSTSPNPTVNNSHTIDGTGTGLFVSYISGLTANTTYYFRSYASSSIMTVYGQQVVFTTTVQDGSPCAGNATLTDYDGNVYNTVKIGNQCWMKENLRTTHYSNGASIPLGSNGDTSSFSPYRYNPNNNASNVSACGYLYNWAAVMNGAESSNAIPSGVQGICPTGWHVPSDAEWTLLTDYVSSQNQYVCGGNANYIAKALASTTGWNSSSTLCAVGNDQTANNATGFGAMAAGEHQISAVQFRLYASFWSSKQYGSSGAAPFVIKRGTSTIYRPNYSKYWGLSVRCLRDEVFQDALPCPGAETILDYDGNQYNTVQIGHQCWMKENVRSTHYADGRQMPLGTDTSSVMAYRYCPNNNSDNVPTYGYLYNWPAVMDGASSSSANPSGVQGVCPPGWHVPSDAEWTQLATHVSSQSQYLCNDETYNIAKALASTTGWNSSTATCAVGNNQSTNNTTGFSAVPAGFYNTAPSSFGREISFWSTRIGFLRYIKYNASGFVNGAIGPGAMSVRCVKD